MKSFIENIKKKLRMNKYFYSFISFFRFVDKFRLEKQINVYRNGEIKFKVMDMGKVTRARANTFEKKEPETINWIESFEQGDKFLDIGSNIGIYSLFAASRNHQTIAIEPDALNYALLNLNIRNNNLSNLITAYCIAIHNETKFAKFNISSYAWGGALNSFDNNLDFTGAEFKPVHNQGLFGMTLDEFLNSINFIPSHIKIDVDGNENFILEGSKKTLKSANLKSLLVELDETRSDYKKLLEVISSSGLILKEKLNSDIFKGTRFSNTYNHIFKRGNS